MEKIYDRPQNLIRKGQALQHCSEVLKQLQESCPPIFREDPMILKYQEMLDADIADIERRLNTM